MARETAVICKIRSKKALCKIRANAEEEEENPGDVTEYSVSYKSSWAVLVNTSINGLQALDFEASDHSPAPSLTYKTWFLIERTVCRSPNFLRVLHVSHIEGVIFSQIIHLINLWGAFYHSPAIFISKGLNWVWLGLEPGILRSWLNVLTWPSWHGSPRGEAVVIAYLRCLPPKENIPSLTGVYGSYAGFFSNFYMYFSSQRNSWQIIYLGIDSIHFDLFVLFSSCRNSIRTTSQVWNENKKNSFVKN
jgi:hypothetical protein